MLRRSLISKQLRAVSVSTSQSKSSLAIAPIDLRRRMASSFTLPQSADVRVNLPQNLSKEQLLDFPAFKNWISRLQQSLKQQQTNPEHEFHRKPYKLRAITVQSVDWFGSDRLGFVKLSAEISNDDDEKLPGAVFLRGPSVGMMVTLQPNDIPIDSLEEKHVILTVQPRIAAGILAFTELPAGMVDDGTFSGAAAKEIKEELDLDIPENQLTDMTALAFDDEKTSENLPKAMFPSAGGSDEYIPLFLHERRVPRDQLKEWTGKLTGLRDDGEKITLKLVKLEDMWYEGGRDAKALGALVLYEKLKKAGKI